MVRVELTSYTAAKKLSTYLVYLFSYSAIADKHAITAAEGWILYYKHLPIDNRVFRLFDAVTCADG